MGPRGPITVSWELALSRAFAEALLESRHIGRNFDRASDVTRVRTLKPEAADSRVNPAWNLAPAVFVEIDSPRDIVANALSSAAATRNRRGIQVLSRPVVVEVFCPLTHPPCPCSTGISRRPSWPGSMRAIGVAVVTCLQCFVDSELFVLLMPWASVCS